MSKRAKAKRRAKLDAQKAKKVEKYQSVRDTMEPSQRYLWPEVPDYIRQSSNEIDWSQPVRSRDGRPAVIVSFDPREACFPISAAILRGDQSYIGQYSIYGSYIPNGRSNPLDLFNVTISDWREKMGRNWDLSKSRKAMDVSV